MNFSVISKSLLVCALTMALQHVACADEPVKQYGIKQTTPSVGTHLTKEIVKAGTIPLNKKYDELSDEQKQTIRDQYDHMPATDEPPFPAKGLYSFYKAVGSAHEALDLQYRGSLTVNVAVDSSGNPTKVDVMDSPSEEITRAAVFALMNQKYKPAVCGGQPCAMQLPLHAELVNPSTDAVNMNAHPFGTQAQGSYATHP